MSIESKDEAKLKFYGVVFPTIYFRCDRTLTNDDNITVDLKPKVSYKNDDRNVFNIFQDITLKSGTIFELRLFSVGTFELQDVSDENVRSGYVNTNAPAVMFPYIRAFISTLTANVGNIMTTLTIPTKFFSGELEEIVIAENPVKEQPKRITRKK